MGVLPCSGWVVFSPQLGASCPQPSARGELSSALGSGRAVTAFCPGQAVLGPWPGMGCPQPSALELSSTGAGFYVDATENPWKTHYRMYSYITQELPTLINASFPVDPQRMSIFGHSMGGHGALICALKNPGKYKSVSAFAPICNPVLYPWGKKAFGGYLGSDQSKWKAYDATHLVKSYPGSQLDILIDQGKDDQFLADGQLLPDNFIAACTEKKIPVVFRLQEGYDHSYYFIATFISDHIRHHAKYLNA
ncbi:PREDICTED: S-formylglutathione hydrolase-like [Elephantulus edwardii]|uniref:S-formylglutathione hydrolase-like n=1 Tax=Elephantulus edwardii TaxID=28737 RepID=UPI0003F0DF93|nr:PREDICTED: S-formylglutathione hydrolase-like [Elephantulus edwardii]